MTEADRKCRFCAAPIKLGLYYCDFTCLELHERGDVGPGPLFRYGALTVAVGDYQHDFHIHVVCTDRRQHKRRILVRVQQVNGRRIMGDHVGDGYVPPDPEAKPAVAGQAQDAHHHQARDDHHQARNAYTFWCPSCPRTPQIKAERWWMAVDLAARAGLDEIDLSYGIF